ncbi:MAG: sigma-70 family RNA polymerase sigma factor [Solirubrobacteraceae bacterium]
MSMTALSAETLFEHDLIDAARNGDDRAFEELYARYNGRITGFIHARVRDHGRSEDVAQEVFISALRRLRSTSQPIQFKPWIYEIAKNACIDEYRRTRRIREVSLDSGDDESDSSVLPSRAPTPLATVETKQRLTDLRGAFGGLSDSHHQLLVLREFEGLSYDEIGARTGMTRQMVESGLFRARRKLTEEYEELASGRRCSQIQSTIEAGRALSARSLGIRERRVFARHLAYCQPCRVAAHLAGVDETLVRRRRIGAKIAGLLPLPLWRWPWAAGRSRQLVFGAQPAVQTLSHVAEPAAASAFGGAAVAAAVLALAGGAALAPVATHADRRVAPPGATRPLARARPAVPPAVGHAVPAASSLAAAHARLRLGGVTRRLKRAAAPAAVRHSRSVPRAPGGPGGPGGPGASGRSIPPPPTVAGGPTSAPLALSRAAGAHLSHSLGSTSNLVTHVAAGLPIAPVSSGLHKTFSAGTRTTAVVVSGAGQAVAGAAQQATGAAGQAAAAVTGVTNTVAALP